MTGRERRHLISVDPPSLDCLRVSALEALHNYVVAACDYDLPRASVVFRRVRTTLDSQVSGTADTSAGSDGEAA